MSKYKIYLSENEAKALRELIDQPEIAKALSRNTLQALMSIGRKIERQADWNTW